MPSCVGNIDDDTGLQAELFIAIGCRVMLTNNTWVDGGLANGCLGTVCAVIYNENKTSSESPDYINNIFRENQFKNTYVVLPVDLNYE